MPASRTQVIRESFLNATFCLLGYVANCDGQINRNEIQRLKTHIKKMNLSEDEQRNALQLFKSGTRSDFNINQVLQEFRQTTTPKLIQILLVHLVTMAKADGYLVKKEMHAIQWLARELGYKSVTFNHLLKIIYIQDQVAQRRNTHKIEPQSHQSTYEQPKKENKKNAAGNDHTYDQTRYQSQDLQRAYEVLGVTSGMTEDEIKKAYQKLVSQLHPDKLVGQGLPPDQLNMATEHFKKVVSAYEFIKKYRSIYSAH